MRSVPFSVLIGVLIQASCGTERIPAGGDPGLDTPTADDSLASDPGTSVGEVGDSAQELDLGDVPEEGNGLCERCIYDFDCLVGLRCLKKPDSATGACVPECTESTGCPDSANFTCGVTDRGVHLCQPKDFGRCGGCPADAPLPSGDGQTCYQCLNNKHCDGSKDEYCNPWDHTCKVAPLVCGPGLVKCGDGWCHQCCIDEDCREGSGPCIAGECSCNECINPCLDPHPVLAVINNVLRCVQCEIDSDCTAVDPTCKCAGSPTYSCLHSDGSYCTPALCESDSQCASRYKCWPDTNTCGCLDFITCRYGEACDPVTHRCISGCTSDSECGSQKVCFVGQCRDACTGSLAGGNLTGCDDLLDDPAVEWDCVAGHCVASGICFSPIDCPVAETYCNAATRRCLPGCLDDYDCKSAQKVCDRNRHVCINRP